MIPIPGLPLTLQQRTKRASLALNVTIVVHIDDFPVVPPLILHMHKTDSFFVYCCPLDFFQSSSTLDVQLTGDGGQG
jgi:hypothetical protein